MDWISDGFELLKQARKQLEKEPWDSNMANYMVRDSEAVKRADLDDLSWSIHQNTSSANDVRFLFEQLEEYLKEAVEKENEPKEGYDWCQRCGEDTWSLERHQCERCGFID